MTEGANRKTVWYYVPRKWLWTTRNSQTVNRAYHRTINYANRKYYRSNNLQ